jgi:outer membrane protein OmpA-like peptidoglycan-associated protein/tetratricopeptide (TPR) repeat protein
MLLPAMIGIAQNYTTKATASEKVQKLYNKALHYSRSEQYEDALKELKDLLKLDPQFIDGYIQWAGIKYDQKEYAEAETYFKKAFNLNDQYSTRLVYQLALTLFNQEKFAESADYFNRFAQSNDRNEDLKKRAEKYAANARFAAEAIKNPVPFEPQKLSSNINTSNAEYFPSLTADGMALVYTTRINNQEDLFVSRNQNGTWQKGVPLEGVNTERNEGTQQISADGRFLVFTMCDDRDGSGRTIGLGSCDIFYSEWRNGRWTKPANMGAPVNSSAWDSQPSISANGQALYFASKRAGGLGGSDIWVSYRQADGRWGKPQNLGENINTTGDDQAPFIHPDGSTLYFMSDGHPGMGGTDLFLARRDSTGKWSKAQNFGYPINTKADESALITSLDGTTAYFSMVETPIETNPAFPTRADVNIYSFTLPPSLRPNPVTYVQAKIIDDQTKAPLVAKVEVVDLKSEQVFAAATTDADGTFLVCLPMGKNYGLNVAKEKYLFHSENFALAQQATLHEPYRLEIGLIPIPEKTPDAPAVKAKPVVLKNVFFETASAALKPESKTELNRLKKLLQDNPALKIRINGHTDNVGTDKDNLTLSEKRAKAVYDYLVQQGIAALRLKYQGFGESQPIDTNGTAAGRQNNRRTEFEMTN